MTSITSARGRWTRKNGKWSLSLGTRGTRVRLFERTKGGTFYRDVWANGRKNRRSLGTSDRAEAEKLGKQLLSALLDGRRTTPGDLITLVELWNRFSNECEWWLDNSDSSRAGDEWSAAVLMAHFGPTLIVAELTPNDLQRFEKARRKGGIRVAEDRVTEPVRDRTIQSDLKFLGTMVRWAQTIRVGDGRLLSFNPMDGYRLPSEKDENHPVATWERFRLTRKALAKMSKKADSENDRRRLIQTDLALVLAEATGRRIGSIRQLRWEDYDAAKGELKWRAEADKKGKTWVVPVPKSLKAELKRAQQKLGAIGGPMFPSPKDASAPMDAGLLSWWLKQAEKEAGLPKLKGGLWHPYRRKWATERKDLPLKDVMAAGGWQDAATVVHSYQHVDRETLLRVMSEPKKLKGSSAG